MQIFRITMCLWLLLGTCSAFYIKKEQCKQHENCLLPNCNCPSDSFPYNISGKVRIDQIPQLVILTFDDDKLDIYSYQMYKKLLENYRNPNGCPIKATFFVSDTKNDTSYCLTRNLYENGQEIALSTLNYECPHSLCNTDPDFEPWDFTNWTSQILTMKRRLERYSAVPRSNLNGFRAPMMEPSSNLHYRIISSNKFVYDSSVVINDDRILWPFTLNYRINYALNNNGPTESFENLWELPVHSFKDKDEKICLKFWEGHCKFENTPKGIAKFLRQNFLRAYYKNRAPFVIHLLADWLKVQTLQDDTVLSPNRTKIELKKHHFLNLEGLSQFINDTLTFHDDVYFVTAQETVEFMKSLPEVMNSQKYNFTAKLHDIISSDVYSQGFSCLHQHFDGKCESLQQREPDYDTSISISLEVESQREEQHKLKLLYDMQSESLFLNNIVGYFIIFFMGCFILIKIYDRFF